ncbi:MAG TPA: RcpC/CpaB family pilus assembly protein [Acidimicrobiales bacterium]
MKRQTLILVVIGVVLFVAGGALAFTTVVSGNKNKSPNSVAATTTPVVVATTAIPAGTTGQAMVAQNMVAIQAIPVKQYLGTDLTSLATLTNVVTTAAVAKGHALETTVLATSTAAISLPPGYDGVTVTMTGVNALAGYLNPGSRVDVYAYVTKLSSTSSVANSTTALPCSELAMADVLVEDVSSTSPSFVGHESVTGRTIPASETVYLAVTPDQAREISFLSQTETISVVQTQKDTLPPVVGECVSTNQLVGGQ